MAKSFFFRCALSERQEKRYPKQLFSFEAFTGLFIKPTHFT